MFPGEIKRWPEATQEGLCAVRNSLPRPGAMGKDAVGNLCDDVLGVPHGTLTLSQSDESSGLLNGSRPNPSPKVPILTDSMIRAANLITDPVLQKWFWPEGAPFCVSLSHDVDEVRWSWRRRLLMGARHPRTLLEPNERYWNFEHILSLERRFGVRSSWYFVADGNHPRDPPYRLGDVEDVMRDLEKSGHEVGVHGSYLSYKDGRMLQRERDAIGAVLGHPVLGVRQHFVNFAPFITWKLQEAAGFSYDATLAFNGVSGFRAGICHPFSPLGHGLLEVPLMLMDGQLFRYEEFGVPEARTNCERIASEVIGRNGLLTMNWHQHTYDEYSFPGYWSVYEHMLQWLLQKGARFITGGELWRWWRARSRVEVQPGQRRQTEASWTMSAAEDISGLALRVLGVRPRTLEADTPHSIVTRGLDTFLLLPVVRAGSQVTVTAEW